MWYKELFLTTALAMVFFTVFVQGSTIKFLVKVLKIKLEQDADSSTCKINEAVQRELCDDIMAGIEVIVGRKGHNLIITWMNHLDNNYIRKWLTTSRSVDELERVVSENNDELMEKHNIRLYGPRLDAENMIKQAGTGTGKRMDTSEVLNIWKTKSQRNKRVTWRHSRFTNEEDKRERYQALQEGLKEQSARTESLEKKLLRQLSGGFERSGTESVKSRCATVSETTLENYQRLSEQKRRSMGPSDMRRSRLFSGAASSTFLKAVNVINTSDNV